MSPTVEVRARGIVRGTARGSALVSPDPHLVPGRSRHQDRQRRQRALTDPRAQRALPDPSLVQGAILAGVPIVCELETDVLAAIRSGDELDVDGTRGIIRVTAKDGTDDAA